MNQNSQTPSSSRRRFLKGASVAIAAPFVSRLSWAQGSPMQKIQYAAIGAGGQANSDIPSICAHKAVEMIAFADVDMRQTAKTRSFRPDATPFHDWRTMLTDLGDKVDLVSVTTPDHMHAACAIAAMRLGKHVYCQKPLGQKVAECRKMKEVAAEKGVVTQMGIQLASGFYNRMAVDFLRNEVAGKVKKVHMFSHKNWGDMGALPDRTDEVPKPLHWDLWTGVEEPMPFLEGYYHPGNWRKRQKFGTATLGDMGCHIIHSAYAGLELTAPLTVITETDLPNAHNWPVNEKVRWIFPGTAHTTGKTVEVTWYGGNQRPPKEIIDQIPEKGRHLQGCIFECENGLMTAPHGSRPEVYPADKFKDVAYPKLEPRDHYKEISDCIIDGTIKPVANFDYAAPMTEFILLGMVAMHFPGKELKWDAPGLKVTNLEEANAFLHREYRAGWEI